MAYGSSRRPQGGGAKLAYGTIRTWNTRTDQAAKSRCPPATVANYRSLASFFFSGSPRTFSSGSITGNVYSQNLTTPVSRRVYLFDRVSRAVVATTLSRASDGYFEFNGLNPDREYFAVAFDVQFESGAEVPTYRAAVFDSLVPA